MYQFDAKKVRDDIINWIREWFEVNGKGCNAIIGISGGKDSSVTAALCAEALGKERVIGVLMPNGVQQDIDMSQLLVDHLQIRSITVNIGDTYQALLSALNETMGTISQQTIVNIPPRLRMTTLYAVSQSNNGRVANTSNLSEDYVGYFTRGGDGVGDFGPISKLTVTEVKAIGRELGLPEVLVDKVPIDGLCGKTDEENLGFTYAVLDRYLREGINPDQEVKERIDHLHHMNAFKLKEMPTFDLKFE